MKASAETPWVSTCAGGLDEGRNSGTHNTGAELSEAATCEGWPCEKRPPTSAA